MKITGGRDEPTARPDDHLLEPERRALANVAYRLLGSLTEAEDAVQEAYTRWLSLPEARRDAISSPGAWLTTVVSRICLDQLRSARVRRERYVGEWIPEPLPVRAEWSELPLGSMARDPADHITLDESVEMAFLVVLDSMTPAERVAFMLHDVFRVPFGEVAEIVGRTPGPAANWPPRAAAEWLLPVAAVRRRRAVPCSSVTSDRLGRPRTWMPSSDCSTRRSSRSRTVAVVRWRPRSRSKAGGGRGVPGAPGGSRGSARPSRTDRQRPAGTRRDEGP